MLMKVESSLDQLAQFATSRKLTIARDNLEDAKRVEAEKLAVFRDECRRVKVSGLSTLDARAREAEAAATAATAAARQAYRSVEAERRTHGEVISRHLQRVEPEAIGTLLAALDHASEAAAKISKAVSAAEYDGGEASAKLGKVRRVARELNDIISRFS